MILLAIKFLLESYRWREKRDQISKTLKGYLSILPSVTHSLKKYTDEQCHPMVWNTRTHRL